MLPLTAHFTAVVASAFAVGSLSGGEGALLYDCPPGTHQTPRPMKLELQTIDVSEDGNVDCCSTRKPALLGV